MIYHNICGLKKFWPNKLMHSWTQQSFWTTKNKVFSNLFKSHIHSLWKWTVRLVHLMCNISCRIFAKWLNFRYWIWSKSRLQSQVDVPARTNCSNDIQHNFFIYNPIPHIGEGYICPPTIFRQFFPEVLIWGAFNCKFMFCN